MYQAEQLVVVQVIFGSNGHIKRPTGQHTVHAYTRCIWPQPTGLIQIKSIVNTAYVTDIGGTSHQFEYVAGKTAVNENHSPVVDTPETEGATVTKIALYHYQLKSLEEFSRKTERSSGDGTRKRLDYFIRKGSQATALCMPGTNFLKGRI